MTMSFDELVHPANEQLSNMAYSDKVSFSFCASFSGLYSNIKAFSLQKILPSSRRSDTSCLLSEVKRPS